MLRLPTIQNDIFPHSIIQDRAGSERPVAQEALPDSKGSARGHAEGCVAPGQEVKQAERHRRPSASRWLKSSPCLRADRNGVWHTGKRAL